MTPLLPSTVLEAPPGRGEVELSIRGMTCSSCVHLIESSVLKMKGITAASVALSTEKGKVSFVISVIIIVVVIVVIVVFVIIIIIITKVSFDPSVLGPREVVEAVNSLGFSASLASREPGGVPDHQEDIR